ncbi:MAG: hypothetical protein JNK57_17725 [Planctomycetaceae bacterium]|nr:hypothetical protein [Planctomycetaceae bacterium]
MPANQLWTAERSTTMLANYRWTAERSTTMLANHPLDRGAIHGDNVCSTMFARPYSLDRFQSACNLISAGDNNDTALLAG